MELTGRCKEEFEKWLVCGGGKETFEKYYEDDDNIYDTYDWFDKHSTSMKYGVYVDFFGSVDKYILEDIVTDFYYYVTEYDKDISEARGISITKANEIYNNK